MNETVTEPVVDEVSGEAAEKAENDAFNAAVNSLAPESPDTSLGGDVDEGEKAEGEVTEEAVAEAVAEEVKAFIGDLTEEQVLEKLTSIDDLEEAMYEKVSQRVFGKFGEVGQQIKALQANGFQFDPEKLTNLTAVDEGIADALKKDLAEALSGQSFDTEGVTQTLRESVLAEMNPYVEERLLKALAPDAGQVVKTEEFGSWFFKTAKQEVRDLFSDWDEGKNMDGVAMAGAITQFKAWQGEKEKAKDVKKKNLRRAVEKPGTTPAAPVTREMSEQEAFQARIKETAKSA